ncbi:MAG: glycosyltransferase family 2 protein [Acidobacteriota bacterium]|nr:glycosyltransferase family 2 protein [Acidobacteriota bacterium]
MTTQAPVSARSVPELSIVIPCLNEAETVAICVRKAREFLLKSTIDGEVIVADNGSTDGSQRLASEAGARVVSVGEKGYGAALLGGFAAARGELIIMGDADDSYDFSSLGAFVAQLRAGSDLVMGNRFAGGVLRGAMPPLHRYLGNPVLSAIGRLFFRSPIGDFHCGLRGFRRAILAALNLQSTGMEFASEMVVKATLLGLRIREVPTVLSPAGRTRAPHLRTWRDGWRHLRFMLLYSPRWLFLYPGALLILAGLALLIWLLPGPQRVAGLTLDVHTLLYAALAILLGFQAVLFAIFTRVFAASAGLLPPNERLATWTRKLSLEVLLVGGLLLVIAGLGGSVYAVAVWERVEFGRLDPRVTFRLIIPSVLALAVGVQIILASFFLSVLKLPQRDRAIPHPSREESTRAASP